MRTKDWLSKLPEPNRSKALKNWNGIDSSHISLRIALCCAFDWEKSSEGKRYWYEVWSELNQIENVRENSQKQ